jgi:alpha-beta hydrolase superfamily lysophospholipase
LLLVGLTCGENSARSAPPAEKLPAPEALNLTTHDGVEINAVYYGSNFGKETVPVILLHGYNGSLRELEGICQTLQSYGFAAAALDFRGHGKSKTQRHAATGESITLESARLGADDFLLMAQEDVEALKRFLLKKNNEGKLNIDSLCVVGVEMGATVATLWAATDWSWPVLPAGKQGQDVKGLILISPEWNFRGVSLTEALNHPLLRNSLSVQIVVGKGKPQSAREARRLFDFLKKYHSKPTSGSADLVLDEFDTSLQGSKLLLDEKCKLDSRLTVAGPLTDRRTKEQFGSPVEWIGGYLSEQFYVREEGDKSVHAKYPWKSRNLKIE